jgi:hypothetical protein
MRAGMTSFLFLVSFCGKLLIGLLFSLLPWAINTITVIDFILQFATFMTNKFNFSTTLLM